MNPLDWIRDAGAPSEADSDRDGFLSYAHESHAVGYGLGIGAAIALKLAGVPWVLEVVLAALGGLQASRGLGNGRAMAEIRDEPQYFLPALAVGFAVVAGAAALLGVF